MTTYWTITHCFNVLLLYVTVRCSIFGYLKYYVSIESLAFSFESYLPIYILVDCEFGKWGDWTECDQHCGVGTSYRNLTIIKWPERDGEPCPPNVQTTQCLLEECPKNVTRNATCSLK